jgi:hypothetical protein
MTDRENFIKSLEDSIKLKRIKSDNFYRIVDDKIYVFGNNGTVDFNFTEGVIIYSIYARSIPADVEFTNYGAVVLHSTQYIDPSVVFNNDGYVLLKVLNTENWKGNIEGVDGKRLLNLMIKRGIFI